MSTQQGSDALIHVQTVRPEWIDYNGHLSEPYYVLVFGDATTAMMDLVGIDAGYRRDTGFSLYTVEAHIRYLLEVPPGVVLAVYTSVISVSGRKLRFWHEMYLGDALVATEEIFALHVGPQAGKAFPGAVEHRLSALVRSLPEHAGRSIS